MNFLIFIIFFSLNLKADPIQDLYFQIIPESLRLAYPAESDKSFKVHLLDSNKFLPPLNLIQKKFFAPLGSVNYYLGTMTYVSVVKKKYIYEVFTEKDSLVFNVRVYFKNATPIEKLNFKQRFHLSSQIWNKYKPNFDFNYYFKFEVVNQPEQAHFKVELKDDIRGPYDTYWNRQWTEKTVAHEIGHMMGLGDEYQTVNSKMDCLMQSLMCSSYSGQPMLHHYYFILRRFVEQSQTNGK